MIALACSGVGSEGAASGAAVVPPPELAGAVWLFPQAASRHAAADRVRMDNLARIIGTFSPLASTGREANEARRRCKRRSGARRSILRRAPAQGFDAGALG